MVSTVACSGWRSGYRNTLRYPRREPCGNYANSCVRSSWRAPTLTWIGRYCPSSSASRQGPSTQHTRHRSPNVLPSSSSSSNILGLKVKSQTLGRPCPMSQCNVVTDPPTLMRSSSGREHLTSRIGLAMTTNKAWPKVLNYHKSRTCRPPPGWRRTQYQCRCHVALPWPPSLAKWQAAAPRHG